MSNFDPYDPLVQQALQAQGSQYVVPQQVFNQPTPMPAQPTPVQLQPSPYAMAAQPRQNMPEQALTSTDGVSMYTAPRVDPMAFSEGMPVMGEQDATPLARIPPPAYAAPQVEQPTSAQAKQAPRVSRGAAPSKNKTMMDDGLKGMSAAITQRQQTAEELGQARADTGRSTADLLSASTVDDAMAQQELADAHETHLAASDKVQQEQREMASFIGGYEPKDRRTTTSRVMGAIAVGLAGMQDQNNLVAGLKQGLNVQTNNAEQVSKMLNTSIDRDIDLQRQMLDNKRTELAAKNTELGQMRERYGDSVESVKLARAMKIDQYQKELDSIVARGQSQEAVLTAQDAKAQLEQQKQQLFFEVYGTRYKQEVAARQGMGAAQRLSLEGKALDNEKKRRELEGGPAGDKATKDKIQSRQEVLDVIDRIKKVRADNPIERGLPGWVPGAQAPAQLDSLNADLMLKAKKAKEMGSLDAGTERVLNQLIGDPASWSSDADTKLDEYKKTTEQEQAALGGPEAMRAYEARSRVRPGAAR